MLQVKVNGEHDGTCEACISHLEMITDKENSYKMINSQYLVRWFFSCTDFYQLWETLFSLIRAG